MLNARTPSGTQRVAGELSPSEPTVTAGTSRGSDPSEARTAGLWGGLALLVCIMIAAGLVAWERRRRAAAHYAALLAHSELRPSTRTDPADPAIPTESPTPPAAAPDTGEPRSVRSLSGVHTSPVSERQWLSQPPPRSSKDPPM